MTASTWNLPAPPGFRGLDLMLPITVYERHLPHWRQDGATYFATYRLHDSLPQERLHELEALHAKWRQELDRQPAREKKVELSRRATEKVEHWLDQGSGSCVLRNAWAANIVADAMHHFDESRYELGCYVVMPNHVHVIVRPLMPTEQPLESILRSWKRFTASQINPRLGEPRSLWQEESFDRIVRDEEHLYRAIQYIGKNPAKAGLRADEYRLWIRPAWAALGWGFVI